MTAFLAALLLAAAATAAPGPWDHSRPRPAKSAPDDATRRKNSAINEAGAIARRSRDIEIIVVGDVEDGAPGANVLELGQVSYRPETGSPSRSGGHRSQSVTILRRMVTVRIGTDRTGFAPLRAHLQADDGRCRIRVDGKTLTMLPQVIDPLAPLGQAVGHLLEIEIATTAAEGPVAASISWTSDRP